MRTTRGRRPPIEQVKSGLRIAGAMVATVATLALFALAYGQIVNPSHTHGPLVGWLLMATLTAAVTSTVQYWRRWFPLVPGYLGMRSSLGLLLGWFSPRGFVYIIFPILMFAMCAMSFRFGESAKMRAFDRALLLVTAACLLATMLEFLAHGLSAVALLFAGIGDLALFSSRIYLTRKKRPRMTDDATPLTLTR